MENRKNRALIGLIFIFLLVRCSRHPDTFKVIKKVNVPVNASVPDSLIRELSAHFLEANPHLKLDLDKVYAKFGFYTKVQWPIKLKVWPKDSSLKIAREFQSNDEATKIDLSQFVSQLGEENDFFMQLFIETERFNKLYVYFLPSFSADKKCSKFYEITKFYHKKLSKKVVLTKEEQHFVKNYLGTYVFFSVLGEKSYQLNLVQVTSSAAGEQLCPYF